MLLEHRIQYNSLANEESWANLKKFLAKYRDCFDSLSLVDDLYHYAWHDRAHNEQVAELFGRRIAELRQMGFASVGIDNMATLGHIEEGYTCRPQPLPPMVGYDGSVSRTCLCPNDPACREHIAEEYALYAAQHPDFLWIDDDVKVHTNGIRFGCFCPGCVSKFRERYGHGYADRESLAAALDEPANAQLRRDWVSFVSDTIDSLFAMIERTVHGIDPAIEMGFETMRQSWSTYNGEDFHRWFGTLKAKKARPGEGTYDERDPFALCVKALDTAQQAEAYPDSVRDRLYEVENFPYFRYQKSARFLTSELALAAAQGMNGSLVNLLKLEDHPDFTDSEAWFDALRANRRQWDALCDFTAPLRGNGFWPAISRHYDAVRPLHEGDSFFRYTYERRDNDLTRTYNLVAAGFPLTADRGGACGAVFIGDMVNGFTDEELIDFLRGGVLMDGNALRALHARGLGGYAGVEVARIASDGIFERYNLDEPMNEGVYDRVRDIRLAFWNDEGCALRAIREGVRELTWMENYAGERLGIACSAYENELGGRVCVLGYGAFERVDSVSRQLELRRIAEYLSGGTLAVTRREPGRLAHFVRSDGARTSAAFVNLYLDDQPPTKVALRGMKRAWQLMPDGARRALELRGGEVELPAIRPFETIVVIAEG